MRARLHSLTRRITTGDRERGETPVAIMIGLVVLAVLVLAGGPALMSFTAQSAANSNDRRADKALAVLTDTARRAPWKSLQVGGPYTERVTLAGNDVTVATWVEVDPASTSRLVVTKAIPAYQSNATCDSAPDPSALPEGCIVRSATVTATATDIRPPSSPTVTLASTPLSGTAAVPVGAGQNLFSIKVTRPLQVAVVGRWSSDAVLHLVSTDIVRARVDLKSSQSAGNWRFGNAIVCPSWSNGGTTTARLATPASVSVSDLLVLTTPASPAGCPKP